ncbi:MAG: 2,3-bisphosphoglycerate-independent phosphoglycerate mutase, partial [bacterium]|nr:2,3-bisphosphoglycerate-independent phosphoglycerate mutase [bacterium]
MTKPVVLVVRDGWGINIDAERDTEALGDATLLADTPVAQHLQRSSPTCLLTTHGLAVGLPAGQMGNSEVGHLNLGAGRVVYQQLTRIDRAIADGSFSTNPVLVEAMASVGPGNRLHL